MECKEKSWMPNPHYSQLRARVYIGRDRSHYRFKETSRSSPLSESIDDHTVMEMANQWLNSCTTKSPGHENCITVGEELSACSAPWGQRRSGLFGTQEPRIEQQQYRALSDCYKTSGQAILTVSNEKNLISSISYNAVLQTIRNAIIVTRSLGIRSIISSIKLTRTTFKLSREQARSTPTVSFFRTWASILSKNCVESPAPANLLDCVLISNPITNSIARLKATSATK